MYNVHATQVVLNLGLFPSIWHLYVSFNNFFIIITSGAVKGTYLTSSAPPVAISEALFIVGNFS